MDEMLKENEFKLEETNYEVIDTQDFEDMENQDDDNNSGSGIGGKLIAAGILTLAGTVGALVYKKKKKSKDTLTKADLKAIEKLAAKGYKVIAEECDNCSEEDYEEVDSEPETEETKEESKEEEKK